MPLESLSQPFNADEPGRKLREVQAEYEPTIEYTLEKAQIRFQAAAADMHFEDKPLWYENFPNPASMVRVNTQMWAVLAESQFNGALAQQEYAQMKNSPMYNAEKKEWEASHPMYPHNKNERQNIQTAVLDALFQNSTKRQDAEALYAKLHQDYFGAAYWLVDKSGNNNLPYTAAQLMPILLASRFDQEGARNQYEALKHSRMFNEKDGMWVYMDAGDGSLLRKGISSEVELLAVLVEAQWDPAAAKKRYEMLKELPLYDAHNDMWCSNYDMVNNEASKTYETRSQMISVWIECEFAKRFSVDTYTPPQIPEERNF